ncbi:MAG: hypothetical protein ABFS14_01285 [Gemmatimonadota bacterium]
MLAGGLAACGSFGPASEESVRADMAEALLELEARLTDPAAQVSPDTAPPFGADPVRVKRLSDGRFLVLLRGSSELVLVDSAWSELSRISTPQSPAGWAFADDEHVFVGGRRSPEVRLFRIGPADLSLAAQTTLEGVAGVRTITYLPSAAALVIADDFDSRLLYLTLEPNWNAGDGGPLVEGRLVAGREDIPLHSPALHLQLAGSKLLVSELVGHRVHVVSLDPGPDFERAVHIELDGPIWALESWTSGDTMWIAAGGVEDRPLDRTAGEFGYVDSFLYLYTVAGGASAKTPQQVTRFNLSEHGLVTPKAIRYEPSGRTAWISGFGSGVVLELDLSAQPPQVLRTLRAPPGTTDFTLAGASSADPAGGFHVVLANSLLDRVLVLDPDIEADSDAGWSTAARFGVGERSAESHLGEALFFTTLMAPDNISDGFLSRFTCETCHFEGGIDGRTHYTGRGHVFATTKTLRGLGNNVPVFSRGGDATLTSMVLSEFEVANQGQPVFTLERSTFPWLEDLAALPESVSPLLQREALLTFLAEFSHEPNPLRKAGLPLGELERKGLLVFRDRCSICHKPLTSTREDGEFVPYDEWESWLSAPHKDLVWGAPLFAKTGVEPYVSPSGARIPSLRRVWRKQPYFTDGSSATTEDLLRRFKYSGPQSWHHRVAASDSTAADDPVQLTSLSEREIQALDALLRLF